MARLSLFPFWRRLMPLGPMEELSFNERRKVCITRGAAIWLATLGPLFCVVNLFAGYYGLALINLATTLIGGGCLWLCRRIAFLDVAAFLLVVAAPGVYFTSALIYCNGMEHTLLLGMLGAVFLFETPFFRYGVALANAGGFFFVKLWKFTLPEGGDFPMLRYGLNLLVILFCYLFILETIRRISENYQQDVEKKNAVLLERKRALIAANQAKERLFSIVAHDLRGPVGNLQTTMELMADNQMAPETFHRLLGRLRREVNSAYDCLDTLLSWSAGQLGMIQSSPQPLLVASVVERCIALLAQPAAHKQIEVVNAVPPEARVLADEDQLLAILRNLLSNALKFTPVGGSVRISAEREEKMWRILVADSGVGMSAAQIAALFEIAQTVSTPGTENERGLGLGLQICREFVQQQGGALSVESAEGVGSTFAFTLPVAV